MRCQHVYSVVIFSQSFSLFINEFSDLLDEKLYKLSPLVIIGDLNIHLDNPSSQHTQNFNDLVNGHGLCQLVTTPTHYLSHVLDVILVRNSDWLLYSHLRVIPGISDHSVVTCLLRFDKPNRDIKGINRTDFANDVTSSSITSLATASVDDAVSRYNSELSRLLDSHAPAMTRKWNLIRIVLGITLTSSKPRSSCGDLRENGATTGSSR